MKRSNALLLSTALAVTGTTGAWGQSRLDADRTQTRINEIRMGQPDTDFSEYIELAGEPGATLGRMSYVVIGTGDDGNSGVVKVVIDLGGLSFDRDGFLLIASQRDIFGVRPDLVTRFQFDDRGSSTHMICVDMGCAVGDDLDMDDDGRFDFLEASGDTRHRPTADVGADLRVSGPRLDRGSDPTVLVRRELEAAPPRPWTTAFSAVSFVDARGSGIEAGWAYAEAVVGPDDRGLAPAHVFRCRPDDETWTIGRFDPDEPGTWRYDLGDTPGAPNTLCRCAADLDGNGQVDVDDMIDVIFAWGTGGETGGDVDGDAYVDLADLYAVYAQWGMCP